MKMNALLAMAAVSGLLVTNSALALKQCPPGVRDCGPNPYYSLAVGFTQVCSERHPESAALYQATLAAMVARYPEVYARMEATPEFKQELQVVLKELYASTAAEVDKQCSDMLDEAAQQQQPQQPAAPSKNK